MYWYLKNLHNETISRKKVQRNFAEFRAIKITFAVIVVISYSRNKKILFRDHPTLTVLKIRRFRGDNPLYVFGSNTEYVRKCPCLSYRNYFRI
jgi:hypothetical protein